jgi:hypothetical protein
VKQFTFQSRLTLLFLVPILYIRFFHFLNLSLSIAYINFSDSDVTAHKLLSQQRFDELKSQYYYGDITWNNRFFNMSRSQRLGIELSLRCCYTGISLWSYLQAVHKLFTSPHEAVHLIGLPHS